MFPKLIGLTTANIQGKNEELSHINHLGEKTAMRYEKDGDKNNKNIVLLFYDLQNVVTLQKAKVSSFFYKKKLNLYNLTAKTSTKKGYCSIWTELTSGRAGNDLASAFIAILKRVIEDHPNEKHLVCWSDSCVPQNMNSHMSHAIIHFLSENETVDPIMLKYSLPGHSCVQEVENMHKNIDDSMKCAEFYSPLGFLRLILKVDRIPPYKVIQMSQKYFKDYANCAKMLKYNTIPFTKVFQLKFVRSDSFIVQFKLSHRDIEFIAASIGNNRNSRQSIQRNGKATPTRSVILSPCVQKTERELDKKKMIHLREMLKYMPLIDRDYYKTLNI